MYKGQIKDFPEHIVEAMLDEQVRQGNKRDVSVFEKNEFSDQSNGGFTWNKAKLSNEIWCDIIINRNFSAFPLQYPRVMLVSDDKKNWFKRVVLVEKGKRFIAWSDAETLEEAENVYYTKCWFFAKDVEPEKSEEKIPEYTMEELFNKLGKFKIKM